MTLRGRGRGHDDYDGTEFQVIRHKTDSFSHQLHIIFKRKFYPLTVKKFATCKGELMVSAHNHKFSLLCTKELYTVG